MESGETNRGSIPLSDMHQPGHRRSVTVMEYFDEEALIMAQSVQLQQARNEAPSPITNSTSSTTHQNTPPPAVGQATSQASNHKAQKRGTPIPTSLSSLSLNFNDDDDDEPWDTFGDVELPHTNNPMHASQDAAFQRSTGQALRKNGSTVRQAPAHPREDDPRASVSDWAERLRRRRVKVTQDNMSNREKRLRAQNQQYLDRRYEFALDWGEDPEGWRQEFETGEVTNYESTHSMHVLVFHAAHHLLLGDQRDNKRAWFRFSMLALYSATIVFLQVYVIYRLLLAIAGANSMEYGMRGFQNVYGVSQSSRYQTPRLATDSYLEASLFPPHSSCSASSDCESTCPMCTCQTVCAYDVDEDRVWYTNDLVFCLEKGHTQLTLVSPTPSPTYSTMPSVSLTPTTTPLLVPSPSPSPAPGGRRRTLSRYAPLSNYKMGGGGQPPDDSSGSDNTDADSGDDMSTFTVNSTLVNACVGCANLLRHIDYLTESQARIYSYPTFLHQHSECSAKSCPQSTDIPHTASQVVKADLPCFIFLFVVLSLLLNEELKEMLVCDIVFKRTTFAIKRSEAKLTMRMKLVMVLLKSLQSLRRYFLLPGVVIMMCSANIEAYSVADAMQNSIELAFILEADNLAFGLFFATSGEMDMMEEKLREIKTRRAKDFSVVMGMMVMLWFSYRIFAGQCWDTKITEGFTECVFFAQAFALLPRAYFDADRNVQAILRYKKALSSHKLHGFCTCFLDLFRFGFMKFLQLCMPAAFWMSGFIVQYFYVPVTEDGYPVTNMFCRQLVIFVANFVPMHFMLTGMLTSAIAAYRNPEFWERLQQEQADIYKDWRAVIIACVEWLWIIVPLFFASWNPFTLIGDIVWKTHFVRR